MYSPPEEGVFIPTCPGDVFLFGDGNVRDFNSRNLDVWGFSLWANYESRQKQRTEEKDLKPFWSAAYSY